MTNSRKNQPIDTSFMPSLPRGFFWDIQKEPSDTAGKENLTLFMRVNSDLEDNVIGYVQMPTKPGPLSSVDEAVLQDVGSEMKESEIARTLFRLMGGFDNPK